METTFPFSNTSKFTASAIRLYFNLTRGSVTGIEIKGFTLRDKPIIRPLYIDVLLTERVLPNAEVTAIVTYQGEHPDLREIAWPEHVPGGSDTTLPGLQVPADANAQILDFERQQADRVHSQHDKSIIQSEPSAAAEMADRPIGPDVPALGGQ